MIARLHRSGGSFKSAAEYCLGDKLDKFFDPDDSKDREKLERKERQESEASWTKETMSDRVAWTQTLNLTTDNPYQAARMMAATVRNAPALKEQAGVKSGGRKLEKPVCHFTLSWRDGERPTRSQMVAAVESSLRALKMQDRQALLVAHHDKDHAHVHVVVNRVSWEDGRAAKLSQSQLHLSRWCEKYERWRDPKGEVQCKRRARHNRLRDAGQTVYDRESRKGNRWHRHHHANRRVGRNRAPELRVQEEAVRKRCRASLRERIEAADVRHNQQWRKLYASQDEERERFAAKVKKMSGRLPKGFHPESESRKIERRQASERADLGRRHSRTMKQLRKLYVAEYLTDLQRASTMKPTSDKPVIDAKQAVRAALQQEIGGDRSPGGVVVKIPGVDDGREEDLGLMR